MFTNRLLAVVLPLVLGTPNHPTTTSDAAPAVTATSASDMIADVEYVAIWVNHRNGLVEIDGATTLDGARRLAREQIRFWSDAADRPFCEEMSVVHAKGCIAVARAGGPGFYSFAYASGYPDIKSAERAAQSRAPGGEIVGTHIVF